MPVKRVAVFIFIMLDFFPLVSVASELTLSPTVKRSTEGFLSLRWEKTENSSMNEPLLSGRLEISRSPDFLSLENVIPLQRQSQVHLSGFTDGNYFARLTDTHQQVISNTASFQIEHRSLTVAGLLFASGLLLFSLLALSIIHFTRQK